MDYKAHNGCTWTPKCNLIVPNLISIIFHILGPISGMHLYCNVHRTV